MSDPNFDKVPQSEANVPPAPEQPAYTQAGYAQPQQAAPEKGFFGLTWNKRYIAVPPPADQKNSVLAYVLWFFLGFFGIHQFYLGNYKRGLVFLLSFVIVTITMLFFIGFLLWFVLFAYWIYDAVTLDDQVQEINTGRMRQSIL